MAIQLNRIPTPPTDQIEASCGVRSEYESAEAPFFANREIFVINRIIATRANPPLIHMYVGVAGAADDDADAAAAAAPAAPDTATPDAIVFLFLLLFFRARRTR